ncbi:hypothetical protein JKP88DRAFT_286138 [Tribonema minus]|uniref:Uncharacterized protein n=1 Tax=Tribonema minus TaxID=303371 RepID=A0A836CL09_9STRA|nr:hypothetical protein JKP88DRAFT_286138 [Tribonema minus]
MVQTIQQVHSAAQAALTAALRDGRPEAELARLRARVAAAWQPIQQRRSLYSVLGRAKKDLLMAELQHRGAAVIAECRGRVAAAGAALDLHFNQHGGTRSAANGGGGGYGAVPSLGGGGGGGSAGGFMGHPPVRGASRQLALNLTSSSSSSSSSDEEGAEGGELQLLCARVQRQEAQLTQHSLALEQMAAAGDDICAVCSEPMDTAAAVPLPCELHHLHLHVWLEFVSSTDTTAYCGAGSDCNLVGGHCSGCTNSLEVYNCPTCRLFKPSVAVLREGLHFVLPHMRNMATKIKDHYRSQAHSAAVRDSAVRVAETAQADTRVLQTAMQEQRQKLQAADVALARMAARIHGADEAWRAAEGARRAAEEAQRAAEEAADAWQDSARLERAALEIERGTKRKSHALTEE